MIIESTLLLRLTPEDIVVAVRVKRWVDVDEIDGLNGQLFQLLQIVPAIEEAGVHHRRSFLQGSRGLFHTAISDTSGQGERGETARPA